MSYPKYVQRGLFTQYTHIMIPGQKELITTMPIKYQAVFGVWVQDSNIKVFLALFHNYTTVCHVVTYHNIISHNIFSLVPTFSQNLIKYLKTKHVKTTGQLNTLQELKLHSKICDGVVFSRYSQVESFANHLSTFFKSD